MSSLVLLLPGFRAAPPRVGSRAFSLIELLCVMAIIGILSALLLGAVGRAYKRVKDFAGPMDGAVHIDELRLKVSKYVTENPEFGPMTLDTLLQRCPVSSKCERYLRSKSVTFFPFDSTSPDALVVLVVQEGKLNTAYPKAVLCTPPYYAK